MLAVFLQGWVRSIGISNMGVPEMTQLAATAKVTPAVNQIELHPWLQWKHVTDYCREHGIVLEVGLLLHASAVMHRPTWSSRKHPGTSLSLSQCRCHNMLCVCVLTAAVRVTPVDFACSREGFRVVQSA